MGERKRERERGREREREGERDRARENGMDIVCVYIEKRGGACHGVTQMSWSDSDRSTGLCKRG